MSKYINAPGKFIAQIKKPATGWLQQTKTGTAYILVPVVVTEDCDQQGREGSWKGYLTDRAFASTTRQLTKAVGWSGDLTGLDALDGKLVRVTVETEETDNGPRHNIRWINSIEDNAKPALEQDAVADIVARFNQQCLKVAESVLADEEGAEEKPEPAKPATRATAAKPKPAPAPARFATQDDDEIPF